MKRLSTALVLLAAALLLSACGFHLRKGVVLPADLGPLRVVSAVRYSPLAESLAQSLARSGAVPAPADAAAKVATLNILQERWGSLPVSVDARGRAQELTLRYAVEYELLRADGSVLVPRQVSELARNYVTQPTEIIGSDSEQEILAREMQRDMVATIMRRIGAVLQSTDAAAAPTPAQEPVPPPAH